MVSASENLRGKRRASNQLEPSTAAAESPRLHEVFKEVSGISFTTLTHRLIKNNCLDLSNDSDGSVLFYLPTEKAETLKEKYLKNPKLIRLNHGAVKIVRGLLKKKNQVGDSKTASLFLEQAIKNPNNYQIFMGFHKVLDIHMSVPEFFNSKEIVHCSEQDFIIKVWGPILSEMFKQTKLTLRWGDTNMENTNAPFRVDLRAFCTISGEKYDVGFAEFAKNFTAPKAQEDRVKLILEGKDALNTVFKVIGKYVPDIEFYTLQIAGLKGHIISTTLQTDGLYTAQNINEQIRFPLTNNDIYNQTSHLIKAIHQGYYSLVLVGQKFLNLCQGHVQKVVSDFFRQKHFPDFIVTDLA